VRLRRKEINVRGKLVFLAGAAAGFVLGSRAGREKYDEIVAAARRIIDSPSVQEAGGVVKAQASHFYGQGKDALSNSKLADKIHDAQATVTAKVGAVTEKLSPATDDDAGRQHMNSNSF
jgi:hypothetical protein